MVVQRRMLRQLVSLATCRLLLRVAGIVARGFNGHFAPRNFKPLTSALGHKRAFSEACMMSAGRRLPQIGEDLYNHTIGLLEALHTFRFCTFLNREDYQRWYPP